MGTTEWPLLPIQLEDLPKIRELLTTEGRNIVIASGAFASLGRESVSLIDTKLVQRRSS